MTTLVVMLCLLCGPMVLGLVVGQLVGQETGNRRMLGCLGVALVFCFTGLGHFVRTEPMAEMLPVWVPGRVPMVYLTGVVELTAAVAVLVPSWRWATGWSLIVMLVLFLPVNIYAAWNQVGMGGHQWGPIYLLVRIPMQAIHIGWIWWFAIRRAHID